MPSCDFNNFDNCTCRDCSRYESDPDHCLICGVEYSEELMEKRKNYYIYYCDECKNIKDKENREIIRKREEEKKNKIENFKNKQKELIENFYSSIDKSNIKRVPIKILDSFENNITHSLFNLGVYKKFLSMKLMDIEKIGGRWYINKNKVELFYNLNMQNYYIIYDPRVHRYHIRK